MNRNIVQQPIINTTGNFSPRFDLSAFESAVWNKGYGVIWESTVQCPCKQKDGSFLSSCMNCMGSGWVMINSKETKMLLHSLNSSTKYKEWSEEKLGTVSITALERDKLSFMDRIIVKDSLVIQSEICQIKTHNTTKYINTIYRIKDVIDCFVFIDSTTKLRLLEKDVDYSFTEDDNKLLILDNTLVNGVSISVRYKHNVMYHVLDIPHDIRNSKDINSIDYSNVELDKFPINAIGRRTHYVLDANSFNGDNILDNSTQ